MKTLLFILWLCPWGLISIGLLFAGHPVWASVVGIGAAVGVFMVLALARAAKGN